VEEVVQTVGRPPVLDPAFSTSSYGFRPGRSAHDALSAARQYVADGRAIVVDIDLEKFFDKVNHDILMARLGRWVGDTPQSLERVNLVQRYEQLNR
jgi:retron-type reverse transcriptase